MRFIPAGVGGVALPVACVAAPARDARAPLVHIARAHCACQQAWSRFGTFVRVDGRGAGNLAFGIRAGTAAGAGSAPLERWPVAESGGGWGAASARNHIARAAYVFQPKKIRHSHGHHSGIS